MALTVIAKTAYQEIDETKEAKIRNQLYTYDDAESYFLSIDFEPSPSEPTE